jgi:hypothetical protein
MMMRSTPAEVWAVFRYISEKCNHDKTRMAALAAAIEQVASL